MCEHGFMFGDLIRCEAVGTCDTCSTPFNIDKICKYIGDGDGSHKLQVLKPEKCSGCEMWLDVINIICGDCGENPFDVTQEFLSLPVRKI